MERLIEAVGYKPALLLAFALVVLCSFLVGMLVSYMLMDRAERRHEAEDYERRREQVIDFEAEKEADRIYLEMLRRTGE